MPISHPRSEWFENEQNGTMRKWNGNGTVRELCFARNAHTVERSFYSVGALLTCTVYGMKNNLCPWCSAHAHTRTATFHQPKGTALGTMVGLLTFGNRKYESLDPIMRKAIQPLHNSMQQLMPLVDKDTEAFGDYMVWFGGRYSACMVIRIITSINVSSNRALGLYLLHMACKAGNY